MAIRPVDHGIMAAQGGFAAPVATGGTITTVGTYKYHTFTSSGTFTVTSLGDGAGAMDVLTVAAAAVVAALNML